MIKHIKNYRFVFSAKFLAVFALSVFVSYASHAQFADTPCDPNYYRSLEARAWLEAQREITQNQNLIFKPDSVLEYTCFDKHVGVVALMGEQMFSETDRWGSTVLSPSPQNEHLDGALERLVIASLRTYDTGNFNTNFLGGRADTAPNSYAMPSSISAEAYSCNVMATVWQDAKCMNFVDEAARDGFFTFEQYQNEADKRGCNPKNPSSLIWQGNIETALPAPTATTPWQFDIVETYLDDMFPDNPAQSCGARSARVSTGLVVQAINLGNGQDTQYYTERVCAVPGCYFRPQPEAECDSDNCGRGECIPWTQDIGNQP